MEAEITSESLGIALSSINCGVWEWEILGDKHLWSNQMFNLLGYSPGEIEADFRLLLNSLCHPNDRAKLLAVLDEAVVGKEFCIECRLQQRHGVYLTFQCTGFLSSLKDKPLKWIGTLMKVHNARVKMAEEKFRKAEAILAQTQALTKCGSWEKDLISGESYWSKQTYGNFGIPIRMGPPPEREFRSILHPEDVTTFYEQFERVGKLAQTVDFEYRIFVDGSVRHIHAIVRPTTDHTGAVVKLHGAVMDIDERKRVEQELIQARKRADAANIAKSQFLSTMSHEIRTPLNAIVGFSNLLLEDTSAPDQVEYLDLLRFSAKNLLALINDILDFSKIEAGKMELEEADFNLKQMLVGTYQSFVQIANTKGIELILDCQCDLDMIVKGDPVRFGQVITNLISNAIKFTDHGSVTFSAGIAAISKESVSVAIQIIDTGIGIPENKFESIFDPFVQASSDTTRQYGGSGLGLAITRNLLRLHGSEIAVESRVGDGSKFYFTINFGLASPIAPQADDRLDTSGLVEGVRILLAEDNPVNVRLMESMFKRWQMLYRVAPNGKIAFEMVQAEDFDLILMDLQMPEWDGTVATRNIRALGLEKFRSIPIIALTASVSSQTKELAFSAGMTDYIAKPFIPSELLEKILHAIKIKP